MPPARGAKNKTKAKKVADAGLALAVELVPMKPKKKAAEAKKKKAAAAKKKKAKPSVPPKKPRAPRARKPSAILLEETPHESVAEHDEYMRRYAGVIDRRSGRFKGVTRGDWEKWFERDPVSKRIRRRDKTREWPVHKQLAARATDGEMRVISTVPLKPEGKDKKGGKKKAAAAKKKKPAAPKVVAKKREPVALKEDVAELAEFARHMVTRDRAIDAEFARRMDELTKKKKPAAAKKPRTKKRADAPPPLAEGMEWIDSRLNAARVPAPSVHIVDTPKQGGLPVRLVRPASEADEHYAGARRIGRGAVKRGQNMDEPMEEQDSLPFAVRNWTTMQSVRLSLQGHFYRLMDIAVRLLRKLRPEDSTGTLEDTMFEMLDRAKDRLEERDLEPIRVALLPKVPYAQTAAVIDKASEEDPEFRQELVKLYQDALKNKRLESVIEAIDKKLPSSQRATVEKEIADKLAEWGAEGEKA